MNQLVIQRADQQRPGILEQMAAQYDLDPKVFEATVTGVCMPPGHRREEFVACMLVAHQYRLNPFTKEIHFTRDKFGKIQAIVGIDGWIAIINRQSSYDGMEISFEFNEHRKPVAATCTIYRKGFTRPTTITEFLDECKRDSTAWKQTPSRMLRHRAIQQCARIAFGISGIMDDDEFARWQESVPSPTSSRADQPAAVGLASPAPPPADDIPDEAVIIKPAVDDENVDPPFSAAEAARLIEEMREDMAIADETATPLSEVHDKFSGLIRRLPEDMQQDAYDILKLDYPE